ncbi:hypothetical protein CLOM_g13753 [Closterium sp. NIES-68]|nr:hypothetical protein CLOM_g13753 [Closterium sp. NIES-68]GJP63647.1 hypothetical protein CLOP_g20713 [Closterium sp. NIES-67]GJP69438.1 hypothetical protein CLOP_g431 [Closterium sp. NIES-67]
MASSRRPSPVTTAIRKASSPVLHLLLLFSLVLLRSPSASASERADGTDASNPSQSSIAAAAAAAAAADSGGSSGAGLGMGVGAAGGVTPDQFVSTEDLPAAEGATDAATDAAGLPDFDPKLAGVEEEERMVEELLTWLEGRGVGGIRGEDAAVKVFIDANTTLKASRRSRANLRMVATRPIGEGEVFLSLPRSLALSAAHAQEEATAHEGEVHPFTALAAWVLRERAKGRASLWAPFVRLLPAHLPFPYLFSDQLRSEFQSQSLILATAEHKRTLSEEYKKCRPEAIANATEQEFLWAVGMVTSRMFSLRANNGTASSDGTGSSSGNNATETVLLPYADLFDTDKAPVAVWEDNSTHITFKATANITAGQHVSVEYGLLANDEAVVFRAMALVTNYRDRVDMFEYPEVAIDFYGRHFFKSHWESFMETDVEKVFADMERALKAEVAKDKYKGIPDEPEFRIEPQASLRAWYGGRLDPRMLGGLAALHAHVINKQAPDYAQLARPAVEYAWLKDPKTTCDDFAASLDEDLGDAIPAAGAGILERAKQMLKAMGTSQEGDVQRMQVVQSCKVQVLYGKYPGDKPLMCPPEFVRDLPEWEVALAYRLSKKEVLSHVVGRLTATCEE